MSNNLSIPIITLCLLVSACAKPGPDLEQLTLKEDVKTLVQDRATKADGQEFITTLPGIITREVQGYHFGPVELPEDCKVDFLLDPAAGKKLCGLKFDLKTDASAKALNSYLFKKYGKPTRVLQHAQLVYDPESKGYLGNEACLWSNVKPGVSMILYTSHLARNNIPQLNTSLLMIKSDTKIAAPGAKMTALERAIGSYSTPE